MRTLRRVSVTNMALLFVLAPIGLPGLTYAGTSEEQARLVRLEGTKNFRDLGGIQSSDGRSVRKGILYRSDKLSELTDTDQDRLREMQIRYIVDFRTTKEQKLDPDNLSGLGNVSYVHMPLYDADVPATTWERFVAMMSVDDLSNVLVESNENLVREGTAGFSRWFELLLAEETTPMIFHCSGGKDRTGLASALFLAAIDVPEEAIYQNYLATNDFVGDDAQATLEKIEMFSLGFIDSEDIEPIFVADRKYLGAAFRRITEDYGSLSAYLESELGLDAAKREELRSKYLE